MSKDLPRLTGLLAITDPKTGKASATFERYWSAALTEIEAKASKASPVFTGVVTFGTFTANADAPVTGYIQIKDSLGNVRKLAVIA